jgi:hypothetical protein
MNTNSGLNALTTWQTFLIFIKVSDKEIELGKKLFLVEGESFKTALSTRQTLDLVNL